MNIKSFGFWIGIAMTAVLALLGKGLATLPLLSIIGQMVIAILLGMAWTTLTGNKLQRSKSLQANIAGGQTFASKMLLRAGIVLLGVRLDLVALGHAGVRVLGTEIVMVTLTVFVGYFIARKLKVEPALAIVVACGTAICGAAAAVAIAVQVRAKSEHTVLGVATVAVLGTLFTIADTLLYPVLGLSPQTFGAYTGATLHEIAHVIAAATPFGSGALDTAILVKLSRVVLLAPVAMIIGAWFARREHASQAAGAQAEIAATAQGKGNTGENAPVAPTKRPLPIPWF
ncbi:MAG: YeiH family protein, partial [Tumebacillaceae bacterium]